MHFSCILMCGPEILCNTCFQGLDLVLDIAFYYYLGHVADRYAFLFLRFDISVFVYYHCSLAPTYQDKFLVCANFLGNKVLFWFLLITITSVTASTSAAMVTPSADTSVSNGVYVPGGITNGDVKPAVSTTPLADFLMQLEEYTPTVSQVLSVTFLCCIHT